MWILIIFLITSLAIVFLYPFDSESPIVPPSLLPETFTNLLFIFAEENCAVPTNIIDSASAVIFDAASSEYAFTHAENISCSELLGIAQTAFSFTAPVLRNTFVKSLDGSDIYVYLQDFTDSPVLDIMTQFPELSTYSEALPEFEELHFVYFSAKCTSEEDVVNGFEFAFVETNSEYSVSVFSNTSCSVYPFYSVSELPFYSFSSLTNDLILYYPGFLENKSSVTLYNEIIDSFPALSGYVEA